MNRTPFISSYNRLAALKQKNRYGSFFGTFFSKKYDGGQPELIYR